MIAEFFIPGPLPGMNEMIAAAKGSGGRGRAYSRMKQAYTLLASTHARREGMPRFASARVTMTWIERDHRRDLDNISAAAKFALDGCVAAGVLPGDGWRHVTGLQHEFRVGAAPGVVVKLDGEPLTAVAA